MWNLDTLFTPELWPPARGRGWAGDRGAGAACRLDTVADAARRLRHDLVVADASSPRPQRLARQSWREFARCGIFFPHVQLRATVYSHNLLQIVLFPRCVGVAARNEGVPGSSPGVGFRESAWKWEVSQPREALGASSPQASPRAYRSPAGCAACTGNGWAPRRTPTPRSPARMRLPTPSFADHGLAVPNRTHMVNRSDTSRLTSSRIRASPTCSRSSSPRRLVARLSRAGSASATTVASRQ